jgi:hypothetical protein
VPLLRYGGTRTERSSPCSTKRQAQHTASSIAPYSAISLAKWLRGAFGLDILFVHLFTDTMLCKAFDSLLMGGVTCLCVGGFTRVSQQETKDVIHANSCSCVHAYVTMSELYANAKSHESLDRNEFRTMSQHEDIDGKQAQFATYHVCRGHHFSTNQHFGCWSRISCGLSTYSTS